MARTSAKSAADNVGAATQTTAPIASVAENEGKMNIKGNQGKAVAEEPLMDTDEIEVISIVPHVSYKDNRTGDMYEWEEIGHSEYMTMETLKNMWRNHKGYFRNLILKPMDFRVVKYFGLTNVYKDYEFLMDGNSYTRNNVNVICDAISKASNGMKYAICNKIRNLVTEGVVTDISVIRTLEKHLDIDLTSLL